MCSCADAHLLLVLNSASCLSCSRYERYYMHPTMCELKDHMKPPGHTPVCPHSPDLCDFCKEWFSYPHFHAWFLNNFGRVPILNADFTASPRCMLSYERFLSGSAPIIEPNIGVDTEDGGDEPSRRKRKEPQAGPDASSSSSTRSGVKKRKQLALGEKVTQGKACLCVFSFCVCVLSLLTCVRV
jgi:hypothetical protein